MTEPWQPRTCSHLIYARTLIGVRQVVRTFSPCHFHVYVAIGTLESDQGTLESDYSATPFIRALIYALVAFHFLWMLT